MSDVEKGDVVASQDGKPPTAESQASENVIVTSTLSKTRIWLIIIGLNLGMMLTALDFNIIAPAVPIISSTFNHYDQASWLGTGMLISFAISLPLYAHLGELLGHRNIFALSVIIFTLGSGLCAGAKSMEWLIWARVVQGAGSGGIYGSVNVIITELVPLREVGRYMSITQATWAIADVAGPLVGGAFAQFATWRWSFWINLFIGPLSLLVVGWLLRLKVSGSKLRHLHRNVDWIGSVSISGSAICLLLAVSWGGQRLAWKSREVIGLFVGGLSLLIIFIYAQSTIAHPLISPKVLRNRTVLAIIVAEFFYGANLVGMIYYIPQFFVLVQRSTIILGGVKLIPMMIGIGIGNAIVGELVRKKGRSRLGALFGVIMMCIASGVIVRWNRNTRLAESMPELFVLGLGQGAAMTGLLLTAQVAVKPHEIGIVTMICLFAQALGDVFGLAIFAALYDTTLNHNVAMLQVRRADLQTFIRDTVHSKMSEDIKTQLENAIAASMKQGWWLMMACALAALLALSVAKQTVFSSEQSESESS